VDGKADWLAHGLPRESERAGIPYIGDLVDPDPPTCALSDGAGVVRERLEGSRYDGGLVLGADRVVLGRVSRRALESAGADATVESLMEPGPTTFRANKPLPEVAERLAKGSLDTAIVTTPRGRLIGAVHNEDLQRALPRG
jgi:predicted transcriptional regulator